MYYVVEYINESQANAAKFSTFTEAKEFINNLGGTYLDFYSEEKVTDPGKEYEVFRRVRDMKQFVE
jgi:hypothetical protein